jgi:Trk K+ transport system NAD-binding subunit
VTVAAERVMLVGEGDLAEETRQALDAAGAEVYRVKAPNEREMRAALEDGGIGRVVVVGSDDPIVLRLALMVRFVDEEVPLLVTLFDETMARQLTEAVPGIQVTSMAEIVAPSLAGPCLSEDMTAVDADRDPPVGLRVGDDGVQAQPIDVPKRRRVRALALALFRPYDKSAVLLLVGAIGLATVLLLETVGAVIVLDQGVVDALYGAAKTLVTVDPNDEVADGPKAFKTFISASMLAALLFEACFTAGLVNRLIDRRLTGIVGRRAVPRRDHVVVVGMGQVGLRLCILLRRCGVGVVAVDDDGEGESVGLARELGLPVTVGRGADLSLLRRLSLERALALAAVTDDDLANLAIAMAARTVDADLRVVIRAGDGRLANETRSLFQLGIVRDVHRIAAAVLAARATGSPARRAICRDDEVHLLHDDGRLEAATIAAAS